MAQRQLPPERKRLFYIGAVIAALGVLCFLSVFVTGALNFGDFHNFRGKAQSEMLRAVGGMVMLFVGVMLMNVGRAGLAGAGLKPDPEEARSDLEPWSRMTGGMLKDVLDEAGIKPGTPSAEQMPVEERLRRLDKLRNEKLINEQEYAETRKRILESV